MMPYEHESLVRLTQDALPISERILALRKFARENDWRPSAEVSEYPGTELLANGHLIVEHGLENAAVITFLRRPNVFALLPREQQLRLVSLSYNNLIDWHFFPSLDGMTCVYNRKTPLFIHDLRLQDDPNAMRSDMFDRIVGRRPNPNIKSLDDALMQTISHWKRLLQSAIGAGATNDRISALLNHIIFIRSIEDYQRKKQPNTDRLLIQAWSDSAKPRQMSEFFRNCLAALKLSQSTSEALGQPNALDVFDHLDTETVQRLFRDFYDNLVAPYPYDFAVISKHALSRIYEHYVSLLRQTESPQLTLFQDLPEETRNKELGGIYTPEYIARFFAKFLRENQTPPGFRTLSILDPACGSGVFLRTILEMQCDPVQEIDVSATTRTAFGNAFGVDIDANACQATRLSLSLLHFLLTEKLPQKLNIQHAESIGYFMAKPGEHGKYDAVIANPPFVTWDHLGPDLRDVVSRYMSGHVVGKPDMYLAHLRLGMDLIKPGGYLLYVLPHSFLLSDKAHRLRARIVKDFWIRFLVDLSEIPVFGKIGSYVVLMILQKKAAHIAQETPVTIVRCKAQEGLALQDALEGKCTANDYYSIHSARQDWFDGDPWLLLSPRQMSFKHNLQKFPVLRDYLDIREGFVSGDDEIFVRSTKAVDSSERAAYVYYLPDRQMQKYQTPSRTDHLLFYPYDGERKMSLDEVRKRFPKTWEYLQTHAARLKKRRSAKDGANPWWCPVRARPPRHMMRPKIVTPHLVLLPKFGLDIMGRFAVSHSPMLLLKQPDEHPEWLGLFTAILNSSVVYWQLQIMSHKYGRGYTMLEPITLSNVRVPNLSNCDQRILSNLVKLVESRMKTKCDDATEKEIDALVAALYQLTPEDTKALLLE